MERKTKVHAEDNKQEIRITREFDLPVASLFKAFTDPEIFAQWMNTKVLKLDIKQHGSWQFETSDPQGNVVVRAHGTIHECIPDQRIVRTFELQDGPFPAQLEFLEFESLTDKTSKLNMHLIFRSVADRDQLLQLPFEYGLNMAHNRLQAIVDQTKNAS